MGGYSYIVNLDGCVQSGTVSYSGSSSSCAPQ